VSPSKYMLNVKRVSPLDINNASLYQIKGLVQPRYLAHSKPLNVCIINGVQEANVQRVMFDKEGVEFLGERLAPSSVTDVKVLVSGTQPKHDVELIINQRKVYPLVPATDIYDDQLHNVTVYEIEKTKNVEHQAAAHEQGMEEYYAMKERILKDSMTYSIAVASVLAVLKHGEMACAVVAGSALNIAYNLMLYKEIDRLGTNQSFAVPNYLIRMSMLIGLLAVITRIYGIDVNIDIWVILSGFLGFMMGKIVMMRDNQH
jgi:hypothetical protein